MLWRQWYRMAQHWKLWYFWRRVTGSCSRSQACIPIQPTSHEILHITYTPIHLITIPFIYLSGPMHMPHLGQQGLVMIYLNSIHLFFIPCYTYTAIHLVNPTPTYTCTTLILLIPHSYLHSLHLINLINHFTFTVWNPTFATLLSALKTW